MLDQLEETMRGRQFAAAFSTPPFAERTLAHDGFLICTGLMICTVAASKGEVIRGAGIEPQ